MAQIALEDCSKGRILKHPNSPGVYWIIYHVNEHGCIVHLPGKEIKDFFSIEHINKNRLILEENDVD